MVVRKDMAKEITYRQNATTFRLPSIDHFFQTRIMIFPESKRLRVDNQHFGMAFSCGLCIVSIFR